MTPEEFVSTLPRRTAHAAHALVACSTELGAHERSVPSAAEVILYDAEALSVQATGSALAHAARKGLAFRVPPRYWCVTGWGHKCRAALEDRYLRETEEDGDG